MSTRPTNVNYSPERRETALSWIRGEGLLTADLTEDARVMAAIGLLICDDQGHIPVAAMGAALLDPSIIQAARALIEEARACP